MTAQGALEARLTAVVRGRVQGVGFRYYVAATAQRLSLRGFVRNLPDRRSVEVVAEGGRADLESLIARLRSGPPAARVDGVEVAWSAATRQFTAFEVQA
ncbi:MAG: acylphosphatase [Actinobacteria bacterium]|nr:acylphosphatase [Actinomycetota bacterium]